MQTRLRWVIVSLVFGLCSIPCFAGIQILDPSDPHTHDMGTCYNFSGTYSAPGAPAWKVKLEDRTSSMSPYTLNNENFDLCASSGNWFCDWYYGSNGTYEVRAGVYYFDTNLSEYVCWSQDYLYSQDVSR